MTEFKFNIQVSKYNYKNKVEATAALSAKTAKLNNVGRMCFKREELTIEEFLQIKENNEIISTIDFGREEYDLALEKMSIK